MSFTTPAQVQDIIQQMLYADMWRGQNRANINNLFNGFPPYTPNEQRDNRIDFNVNDLSGTRIIFQAHQTYTKAFQGAPRYFDVALDTGPKFKREVWSEIISKEMNRIMKRSNAYSDTMDSQFGASVLHGVGPVVWPRDGAWCPTAKGPEDILVPMGTLRSLENLEYFAIQMTMTSKELVRLAAGNADGAWNQPMLKEIIQKLAEQTKFNMGNVPFNQWQFPEKVAEYFKENSTYLGSDTCPTIRCWDFYFSGEETKEWRRRIVVDPNTVSVRGLNTRDAFLFNPKDRNYGVNSNHIMSVLFADGCVVAPYKWHSIRSLGYLLYAVCHANNRIRSKFYSAVMESMQWYFRNNPDGDEERLERVDLHHLGVIPNGVTWVLPQERHTVDQNLVGAAFSMNRQLMAESAASYVQDADNGSGKEQTATEVMAKVQQANALVGSMLTYAYRIKGSEYREIARRFCTVDSVDTNRFRERCMAQGVDKAVFDDMESWDINPIKVGGAGNKILQMAQAQAMMQVYDRYSPKGQAVIRRQYAEAAMDNPELAQEIEPEQEQQASSSEEKATLSWGTLMDGKQVVISGYINTIEYVETLLKMLVEDVATVSQTGQTPPVNRIIGYETVLKTLDGYIREIGADPNQKGRVQSYMDLMGQIQNRLKGWIQQTQEAMQAQQEQGAGGEGQAEMVKAQTEAEISKARALQEMEQDQIRFQNENMRKDAQAALDAQRANLRVEAETQATAARTQAEIAASAAKTAADIEFKGAKAEAVRPAYT